MDITIADLYEDVIHLIFSLVPPIDRLPLTEVCRSWSKLMERLKVRIATKAEFIDLFKRGDLYSLVKTQYSLCTFGGTAMEEAFRQYSKRNYGVYHWLRNKYLSTSGLRPFLSQASIDICKYGTDEMIKQAMTVYMEECSDYLEDLAVMLSILAERNKIEVFYEIEGTDRHEDLYYVMIATGRTGNLRRYRDLVVNRPGSEMETFILACKYGNMNITTEIFEALMDDDDSMFIEGIEEAARKSRHDMVRHILRLGVAVGADPIEIHNNILYGACRGGDFSLIDFAVRGGATNFNVAILGSRNLETVIKMISVAREAGDDIDPGTMTNLACRTESSEILEYVVDILCAPPKKLKLRDRADMFGRACFLNNPRVIDRLIARITDKPYKKEALAPLLTRACESFSIDVVIRLINLGADVCNCGKSIAEHLAVCMRNGGRV